jgi:hypothetical protein
VLGSKRAIAPTTLTLPRAKEVLPPHAPTSRITCITVFAIFNFAKLKEERKRGKKN